MTSHTPGPWLLGEFEEHLGYDCMTAGVRVGPVVLDGMEYGQGRCIDMSDDAKSKMMADARLISAAPDLLAALEEAVLQIEYLHSKFKETGSGNTVVTKARSAIAKARGEA